jgi:hypothetical protein
MSVVTLSCAGAGSARTKVNIAGMGLGGKVRHMCGSGFALRHHGSEPPVRQGAMRSLHWIDGDVVQPDHTKDHGHFVPSASAAMLPQTLEGPSQRGHRSPLLVPKYPIDIWVATMIWLAI